LTQQYYAAFLDLQGRDCLVVGGGRLATEKAEGLLQAGARVTVVAPELDPELLALGVEVEQRPFEDADVEGRAVVIAATDSNEVNRRVFEEAERRTIFCNVVDTPELCSFILPAIHRHDPITVAVSTGGASPALAQWLRDRFASQIGAEHAELAAELRRRRPWARRNLHTYEERRDYFRSLVTKALG
jgi:siroheme synthase-like protein